VRFYSGKHGKINCLIGRASSGETWGKPPVSVEPPIPLHHTADKPDAGRQPMLASSQGVLKSGGAKRALF
jgi:hypothetical protein